PRASAGSRSCSAARGADRGLGARRGCGGGDGLRDPSRAADRSPRLGPALLAPGPGGLAELARVPMGAPATAAVGSRHLDPHRRARGRMGGHGDDLPRSRASRPLPRRRDATDGGAPRLVAPAAPGVWPDGAPDLAALVRAGRAAAPGPAAELADR